MKLSLPKIFDLLAILAILAAILLSWSGGVESSVETGTDGATAVRVEIQRYMGYETLLMRYLSLPYDVTMNVNEQLPLLDTGFLLLVFIPVFLLLGFRQRPLLQWSVVVLCLFFLTLSVANGLIMGTDFRRVDANVSELNEYLATTSFADAPAGVLSAVVYKGLVQVYNGSLVFLEKLSGDSDAVTYPLLILLFALGSLLMFRRFNRQSGPLQALGILLYVYAFFWLILSSGIVWYGYLIFPLATALVWWAASRLHPEGALTDRIVLYGFCLLAGASVLMGFAHRMSNIKLAILNNDPLAGKRLYDPAYLQYQAGDMEEKAVVDAFYKGMGQAVNEINRETESLIYNVGTRFNFFIRENDRRIVKDNQLDLFNQLQQKYPNKIKVAEVLKNAGFRYIMVDLYTPTADNTPEQTLVTKFKKFLLLLYDNPSIELIATDRVVRDVVNGQESFRYGVFGDVKDFGSYAVFRIR